MKATELKKFIKDAVKESMTEVLGEILLEAIKLPKPQINETYTSISSPFIHSNPPPPSNMIDKKQAYMDILGETAMSFTSKDVQKFNPGTNTDSVNGSLPEGDVGMDQIMGLMGNR